jgi:phage tail-like protein
MMIEDPLPSYRFIVTLDPADAHLPPAQAALLPLVPNGSFQEARGLGADLEITAYPEGGANSYAHQLPVRHTWSRISLKRGVVREMGLWWWYQQGLSNSLGARRDGASILLTPAGTPAAKWTGPELNAGQSAVAVETLEIAHEGLQQIYLSPPLTS